MKAIQKYKLLTGFLALMLILPSCSKQDEWLEVKSAKIAVIPKTLEQLQQLLDNDSQIMNYGYPVIGNVAADNITITSTGLATIIRQEERNTIIWADQIWTSGNSADWVQMFQVIAISNVVLEGLEKISSNDNQYNNVKGQALFFRAYAYFGLAQIFCKQYDSATSITDLGLPLRKTSDVNILSQRSSLEETYKMFTEDTQQAANLLSITQLYNSRPCKAAAFALLAKIFLVKGEYPEAQNNANTAITLNPNLLDFNSTVINFSNRYRFPAYGRSNPEILFYASTNYYTTVSSRSTSPARVSMELYNTYDNQDLRKTVYYNLASNQVSVYGSYTGSLSTFSGLSINEMYLTKAECNARLGNVTEAINDLNTLLVKRYKTGTFVPLAAATPETALSLILNERRKELAFFAQIRWEDLRRLNKDPRFRKTLTRDVSGTIYTLDPNSPKYVFPIPDNEIQISGIQQNER